MSQPDTSRNSIFDKRPARLGVFLLTLVGAMLVMPAADTLVCDYLIFDYGIYARQILTDPVVLFGAAGPAGPILGWLIYAVLSSLAVSLGGSRRFWRLYAAFVLLLAANIGFILIFTLSFGRSFGYRC
jgi:hypothetical protein